VCLQIIVSQAHFTFRPGEKKISALGYSRAVERASEKKRTFRGRAKLIKRYLTDEKI